MKSKERKGMLLFRKIQSQVLPTINDQWFRSTAIIGSSTSSSSAAPAFLIWVAGLQPATRAYTREHPVWCTIWLLQNEVTRILVRCTTRFSSTCRVNCVQKQHL